MCLLAFSASAASTSDGPWQLARHRDGIKVYTRSVAGSRYKAVKAEMTIRSSLSAVSALVRDNAECPRWQALCQQARALKTLSPQKLYVYQTNNLPWPVSDRDVVALVTWHQNRKTLAVTMNASAVKGMLPHKKGYVRVTHAQTHWTFTPLAHGRVRVVTEAHINPGGPIPAWLVNMLLVSSPYKTLTNMRRILKTGRFDKAHVGFIKEPEQ